MHEQEAFDVANCGVSLDRCSTSLLESSILPLESVVVAQKTMAEVLFTIKIAKLSADGTELPLSKVRLTLPSPMSSEEMTAAHVRRAMRDAGIVSPAVKVELFFKDEEDDFVTLPRMDTPWPDCCISDGVLKAWFRCVPEPPPTPPSTPVCACLGPHVHQPPKKKLQALDQDDFQGYSLLAAAEDGCASCVEYWLDNGVDPNFQSSTSDYTAMDFVRWAEKKSNISPASAKRVKEVLAAAGGRTNKL